MNAVNTLDLSIKLEVASDQIADRLAAWTPPTPRFAAGVMGKYARLVASASEGAVTAAGTVVVA